jgi:hypothetical protein
MYIHQHMHIKYLHTYTQVYSTGGISWKRNSVKLYQVNMCTYLAKGNADYVGILYLHEYLCTYLHIQIM